MAWSPKTTLLNSPKTSHDLGAIGYQNDLFVTYTDTSDKVHVDRLTSVGWVSHNTQLYSPKGPALAVLNNQLYLFWNSGSSKISYAYWNSSSLSWSSQGVIPDGPNDQGDEPETDSSPFAFGFQGSMYMVHRRKGSDLGMSVGLTTSGAALSWQGDFKIKDNEGDEIKSDHGPTLVGYGSNEMYMFTCDNYCYAAKYQGNSQSDQFSTPRENSNVTDVNSVLGVASFGDSTAIKVLAYKGKDDYLKWASGWPLSWSNPVDVWSGQKTKRAPALAYYAGQMYLFFVDTDDVIRFATLVQA